MRISTADVEELRDPLGPCALCVRTATSAQQALFDYVRSLGCPDSEMVRLGAEVVAWHGARYSGNGG